MVTTLPTIDLVSIASYETLTKLREQMEAHYVGGGHNIDRNKYFTKGARRAIDDILKRTWREQAQEAQRLNKRIDPYVDYGFTNWTHEKFFGHVPQLLRVDKVLSTDPITDCLKQIPKLIYSYLESGGHGELQLHEGTMEVFRNTQVWVTNQENENTALWKQYPTQGAKWLRNSIHELTMVIDKGRGTEIRVRLIASTLTAKEKNFPSQTITDFFDRFKEVAHQKRNESCQRKNDDCIYQEILNKDKTTSPIVRR
jgi:hypothetical protein